MCHAIDTTSSNIKNHDPLVITIIGGDSRQHHVASYLANQGYEVRALGLGDALLPHIKVYHHLVHAMVGCHALVLPLPATRDQQSIFTPLDTANPISFEALQTQLSHMCPIPVFGGRIPLAWREALTAHGCAVTDYYQQENVQIQNARITAEGAIMTAMELTDRAILGTPIAVLGYGRIGQYLSRLLVAWGAKVTVYARKNEALAQAMCDGCNICHISDLSTLTQGYGVIFNTVPARLIGKNLLSVMPCDTLLIDLASPPFGIDPDAAGEMTARCGLGVVFAPSLPGRYAPRDAGVVLAQSILDTLTKGGA